MFKTPMLKPSTIFECGDFKVLEWRPTYKEFMAVKIQGLLEDSKTIKFNSFGILLNMGEDIELEVNGKEYFLKAKGVSLVVKGTSVKLNQGNYNLMICLENEDHNIEIC